jgi:hypothetical protein
VYSAIAHLPGYIEKKNYAVGRKSPYLALRLPTSFGQKSRDELNEVAGRHRDRLVGIRFGRLHRFQSRVQEY